MLMLAGCKKDNPTGIPEGALLLTTEGFVGPGGAKTSVSYTSVQWDNGDKVNLNGTNYTVTVDDARTQAYVEDFTKPGSGVYYGYCPDDLTVGTPNKDTTTVTVPSHYECRYIGGRQVINLPLIGKANYNDDVIRFRHVTAAVKLDIKNATGVPVVLDSVVVSSATQQLSGSCGVTISVGGLTVDAPQAAGSAADKRVKVTFTDSPEIATNAIKDVQIPILPISKRTDNDFTITIYTHANITGAAPGSRYIFSRAGTNDALARNEMMTAKIALSDSGSTHATGLITVDSLDHKVFFSQANLKYLASTMEWRFHDYQWDFIGTGINSPVSGSNNENIAQDYTGWIDLFGWGTSNHDGDSAWMVGAIDSVYGNGSTDIAGTDYDWGVKNPISNGGGVAGMWRTLTSKEWNYVLFRRAASKVCSTPNARFAKGVVNSVCGLIIFPDTFAHPEGVKTIANINVYDGGYYGSGNENDFSQAEWTLMESAGAVFLPATGYRDKSGVTSVAEAGAKGYYWSSTHGEDKQKAQRLHFSNSEIAIENNTPRHLGHAVRLVRDVVPGQSK